MPRYRFVDEAPTGPSYRFADDRMNGADAFGAGFGDAITLGFGDEAIGGVDALLAAMEGRDAGEAYRQRRDEARGRLEQAREERPGFTMAGGLTASLVPGTAAFRAARLAGVGGRAALYSSSALTGGLYGAGSGETAAERGIEAGIGTGLGLVGAGAGEALGTVAALATRGGADPAQRAARLAGRGLRNARTSQGTLERRLIDQGMTPAQARREAARIIEEGNAPPMEPEDLTRWANQLPNQGGPVTEIAAEAAPTWANTARAVATVDGPGQGIAKTALDARRTGLRGRMLDQAQESFKPAQTHSPREYYDFLNSLRGARDAQRQSAFNEAYRTPVDDRAFQDTARTLMHGGRVQERALQKAIEIAEFDLAGVQGRLARVSSTPDGGASGEAEGLMWSAQDIQRAIGHLRQLRSYSPDAPDTALPNGVNARTLEYYQQALWDIVEQAGGKSTPMGGAASQAWSGFTAASDMIAPRLADARISYGRSMRIEEMAQAGRKIFDMADGEIDALLRGANRGQGATLEEGDAFVIGALEAIDQKLGSGDTAFVARLMRNENWKAQLQRSIVRPGLTGRERTAAMRRYTRFISRLNREVAQQETNNFVQSGSRTTPLQQDIRALTDGESELGFLSDLAVDSGFRPEVIATRGLSAVYDRLKRPGIYDPKVNQELARLMYQPATRQNMTSIADRIREASAPVTTTPRARGLRAAAGVVGAQTATHQRGPRRREAAQ
ncbi:hypothetical protein [Vitreimonas flagellata]|uniref:hypothetical protein n=1 Tax=Vitreimonas flagellata TaxID=2560861 RepID=UPI00107561C6|nr:hypothetical protein [Vitreimonas flagellata]